MHDRAAACEALIRAGASAAVEDMNGRLPAAYAAGQVRELLEAGVRERRK